jgi:hypothetical protein
MTSTLEMTDHAPQLHRSVELMKAIIPGVGCGVPAGALDDHALAAWVRAHGLTVTAHDDGELDLLRFHGIRPIQVVWRCGVDARPIRRSLGFGVSRFIVDRPEQMDRLAEDGNGTKYIYLDEGSPLVVGDRQLKVIGLHGDVDDSDGTMEWGTAAERLLCRAALLKTCGASIKRITLSGGSTDMWMTDSHEQLATVASAVDDALREGCARWQLPRPTVSISPLTLVRPMTVAVW